MKETNGFLRLPEEDPDIFKNFLICMHRGPAKLNVSMDPETDDIPDVFERLAEVWVVAHRFEDFRTANEVVDEIKRRREMTRRLPGAACINTIFMETEKYSRLRALMIDYFVLEAGPGDYQRLRREGVCKESWYELAMDMKGLVREVVYGPSRFEDAFVKTVEQKPKCDYHMFTEKGCASCGLGEWDGRARSKEGDKSFERILERFCRTGEQVTD